jgi:hypothetical protein
MNKQELTLQQIITGRTLCKVCGDILYIKSPTPEQKLVSQQIYMDMLYEAELEGVLTDAEMQKLLLANGLWSEEEEKELETAPTRIDNTKEEMYRQYAAFQSDKSNKARKLLNRIRLRAGALFQKRHTYDIYTCSGIATIYQLQHLLMQNTVRFDNTPIQTFDDIFIRFLSEQYVINRPADTEIRQISKIDVWKSIWNSAKGSTGVFGTSAVGLSDEQRSLIGWSRLYDNIMEASTPPEKKVMEDDDLLDGWLIVQHKKNQQENSGDISEITKRHPNATEIFVPVETYEDARRIEGLNDLGTQMVKQQRTNLIKKYGHVEEQHMPDSRQKIAMEATRRFVDNAK